MVTLPDREHVSGNNACNHVGLMSMKQRMEKLISTLREKAKRAGVVRKTVGLGLAVMMVIESPSWSGLIGSALAQEDKAGASRCIYVDTSMIGADSDVMESGIGAYVYDREGNSYSDAPIIMEKVEGKKNIYQLVLDDYYTYVEFTKGSDLNTGAKTGALAIDWGLGAPCYKFNSEALSDGGHFYGLYTIYFDLNNVSGANGFTDNGVGIYAYNSETESYSIVPVAMKESSKGNGIYEYSFDKPYDYVAFMGGYGTWSYSVATAPVYAEWEYNAPCFLLGSVDGFESTGMWRDLTYVVYFDASEIKEDEAFEENGVYLYAYSDSGDVLSENPVKMIASSKDGDTYEYTMEKPYEYVQFILGDSFDAEIQSEVFRLDWLSYADPCYTMTLDRIEKVSPSPSASPSGSPSASPSGSPSATPSGSPSASPSGSPDVTPSVSPSTTPSVSPSATPSVSPSATATPSITPEPTPTETPEPTEEPAPTLEPTEEPTLETTTIDQSKADNLLITHGFYTMSWVGTEGGTLTIDNVSNPDPSVSTDLEGGDSTIPSPDSEEEEPATPSETEEEESDTEEDTDLTESLDKGEELTEDTSDITDEDEVIVDGEWNYDTEPSKAARPAAAKMRRAVGGTKVIYFDAGNNPSDSSTYNWDKGNIYVAFLGAGLSDENNFFRMTLSERRDGTAVKNVNGIEEKYTVKGPLYELEMPEEVTTWSGVIFITQKGWYSGPRDGYKVQTSNGENTADEYPCYTMTGNVVPGNNNTQDNYEIALKGDLGPISKAGSKMYFVDMTSASGTSDMALTSVDSDDADSDDVDTDDAETSDIDETEDSEGEDAESNAAGTYSLNTSSVVAVFSIDGEHEKEPVHRDASGAYEIPGDDPMYGAYSTVAFKDENTNQQLGETYNFLGGTEGAEKSFQYNEGTVDTFYYGATEKADGEIISKWGKKPSTNVDYLTNHKLYFDKLYFKVSRAEDADSTTGAGLQIGNAAPIELIADANDDKTYSYTFTGAPTATTQTILTYIDQDGTKYHFFWDKFVTDAGGNENNLVTLEYEIAQVDGQYVKGNTVYFDATLSKLSYEGTTDVKNHGAGIPKVGDSVYFAATGNGKPTYSGKMTIAEKETWHDVWKVDLPDGYTRIRFFNYSESNINNDNTVGDTTEVWDIPANIDNPCFYADDNDAVIYNGGKRGGYWDEVYTIRNPEEHLSSSNTTGAIVDIAQENYTRNSKRLYVKTTLYDYYTDYELNGNNRDSYTGFYQSHRDWVTFRHFDQALSEYYKEANEPIPIYTGHFQPKITENNQPWAFQFNDIAGTLDLYGFGYDGSAYNRFFSTNNSVLDVDGKRVSTYANVAQGLVAGELKDGQLYASGDQVMLPYFNEDFLAGNNSKNTVLGKVYENVSFPFELKDVKGNGIEYWVYDSDAKSLEMKQTSAGEYYLYEDATTPKKEWSQNREASGAKKTEYGFFPFNSGSTDARNYNYGFGAKLEINFRLTPNGTVTGTNGDVPIEFEFSGDDDVWVFIDGHLALDMGGAHAASHGYLDFAARKAHVDNVKSSAGTSRGTISDFQIDGVGEDGKYDTREHTLTMFYMERGMWESNMKITFNFPDENQLEVQKKVDTSNVNELFKDAFNGHKIFEFSIRNLATHFPDKGIEVDPSTLKPTLFNPSFEGAQASWPGNEFVPVGEFAGHTGVARWLAKENDEISAWRDRRYGIIPALGDGFDANGMRYLQFSYYYAGSGYPALNNMYLRIETTGGTVTHRLSGRIYGSTAMKSNQWGTLTVDLDKFFGQEAKSTTIKSISFGYDYSQTFYLDDFVFIPGTTASKLTGFITKQPEIPDYDTAWDPQLKVPVGAEYTRRMEDAEDTYGKIDSYGTFALENGETVLFRDQFRRGSYIELKELFDSDSPIFTTTWTMYENDEPVTGMKSDKTVTVDNPNRSMVNQSHTDNAVWDGRTESVLKGEKDGFEQENSYSGSRPGNDVFVFRSYADPQTDAGVTKLKVVFTNKVNVGNLVIRKSQAQGSDPLNAEYPFRVTFTNIAGMGLEGDTPIVVEFKLKSGDDYKIEGIPLFTNYVIEELEPGDKSFLAEVKGSGTVNFDAETEQVRGTIETVGSTVSYEFVNMLKPTISIEVTKAWKDAAGNTMEDSDCPENIYIRLQRRIKDSNGAWESDEKYNKAVKLGTVGYERIWVYKFSDLEKYVNSEKHDEGMYEYRVVEIEVLEMDADGNVTKEKVVENGGFWHEFQVTYTYDDNHYIYGNTADSLEEELYNVAITNVHTVSLKVIKVDAENKPLGGVTFKLEQKIGGKWEPVNVTKPDGSVQDSLTTLSTAENEFGGAGIVIFSNLPSGEYRLIETATAPGHTLLANPILININKDGNSTYTINGETVILEDNTIVLTIKNGQNLTMPSTGGAGPIPFTVGGLSICMIASLMYIDSMRKRRKEGKAS